MNMEEFSSTFSGFLEQWEGEEKGHFKTSVFLGILLDAHIPHFNKPVNVH